MICDMCGREQRFVEEERIPSYDGRKGAYFQMCPRCAVIIQWAVNQCMSKPLEIIMERDIRAQVEQVCTTFASFEEIRRLTRQEFRALLGKRLQEFGDKCIVAWDEKCGGGE